jgi:hypothetical protein
MKKTFNTRLWFPQVLRITVLVFWGHRHQWNKLYAYLGLLPTSVFQQDKNPNHTELPCLALALCHRWKQFLMSQRVTPVIPRSLVELGPHLLTFICIAPQGSTMHSESIQITMLLCASQSGFNLHLLTLLWPTSTTNSAYSVFRKCSYHLTFSTFCYVTALF